MLNLVLNNNRQTEVNVCIENIAVKWAKLPMAILKTEETTS